MRPLLGEVVLQAATIDVAESQSASQLNMPSPVRRRQRRLRVEATINGAISLFEVEEVLRRHPAVADAVAFAVPCADGSGDVSVGVAIMPWQHTPTPTAADLCSFAGRCLPPRTRIESAVTMTQLAAPVPMCKHELRSLGAAMLREAAPTNRAANELGTSQTWPSSIPESDALVCAALGALGCAPNLSTEMHTPFSMLGVDSLVASRLVTALNVRLAPAVELRESAIFDHPSPRLLAAFILAQLQGSSSAGAATAGAAAQEVASDSAPPAPAAIGDTARPTVRLGQSQHRPIRIMSGRALRAAGAPRSSRSIDSLTASLMPAGGDVIQPVQASRWATREHHAPLFTTLSPPSAWPRTQLAQPDSASAYGGFVAGVQCFDSLAFGIMPAEAAAIDPQQRLLLEVGYEAAHSGGMRRANVAGSPLAVFVGLMNVDFGTLADPLPTVYAATGAQPSVASGRLSFALGMQGPVASIDTACSSALTALYLASEAGCAPHVPHGPSALVASVNLMLSPGLTLCFARAGMLARDGTRRATLPRPRGHGHGYTCSLLPTCPACACPHRPASISCVRLTCRSRPPARTGRCKTFDSRADGYGRSEAVGAVLTAWEPHSSAICASIARIGACSVRADGKSASLTAPNGSAQAMLLACALDLAHARWLDIAEAHGTGTALGDPTELGGLERALGRARVCLRSGKANLGHAEPAAGLVGLLSLASTFAQRASGGNGQLRSLNHRLELARRGMSASVPTQLAAGPPRHAAGVSSFGYSGTLAHAVLLIGEEALSVAALPLSRLGTPRLLYRRRTFWWRGAAAAHGTTPPIASSMECLGRATVDSAVLAAPLPSERSAAGQSGARRRVATAASAGPLSAAAAASAPSMAPLQPAVAAEAAVAGLVPAACVALPADAAILALDATILALGASDRRGRERTSDAGSLVRILLDATSGVAQLELHDPHRFNTMSWPLGEDMCLAVSFLRRQASVGAVAWHAAGSAFCAGASPYTSGSGCSPSSLAGMSRLILDYKVEGFVALARLPVPVICAVHGAMVGGGVAIAMQSDMRVADQGATFQHGNLSRGVCPVAGFSRTLPAAIGLSHTLRFYLGDETLGATAAYALGIVHELAPTVSHAKRRAVAVSAACVAHGPALPARLQRQTRGEEEEGEEEEALFAREAVMHSECLLSNGGLRLARPSDGLPSRRQDLHLDPTPTTVSPSWAHATARARPDGDRAGLGSGSGPSSGSGFEAGHAQRDGWRRQLVRQLRIHPHRSALQAPRGALHCEELVAETERQRCALLRLIGATHSGRSRPAAPTLANGPSARPMAAGDTRPSIVTRPSTDTLEAADILESLPLEIIAVCAVHTAGYPSTASLLRIESSSTTSLGRASASLAAVGSLVRAIVVYLPAQRCAGCCRPSVRIAAHLGEALAALRALRVPIVCAAEEGALHRSSARALWRAADYGLRGTAVGVRTDGSEAIESSVHVKSEALQLGCWVALHPVVGMRHMLELSRRQPSTDRGVGLHQPSTGRGIGLHAPEPPPWMLAAWCTGTNAEARHEFCSLEIRREIRREMRREIRRAPMMGLAPTRMMMMGGTMAGAGVDDSLAGGASAAPHASALSMVRAPSSERCIPPVAVEAGRRGCVQRVEVYVPNHCVRARALEAVAGHVEGGGLMEQYSGCGDDEDAVSMGLTAVRRLMSHSGVLPQAVGWLCVGSSSLVDRSKGMMSEVMSIVEGGPSDVEGVDQCNGACALLSCLAWTQSSAWDGRWAVAVCSDVALGRQPGAMAVAMLVGRRGTSAAAGLGSVHLDEASALHRLRMLHRLPAWASTAPLVEATKGPTTRMRQDVAVHVSAALPRSCCSHEAVSSLGLVVRVGPHVHAARVAGVVLGACTSLAAALDARAPLEPAQFLALGSQRRLGVFGWIARGAHGGPGANTYTLLEVAAPPRDSALMRQAAVQSGGPVRRYGYVGSCPAEYAPRRPPPLLGSRARRRRRPRRSCRSPCGRRSRSSSQTSPPTCHSWRLAWTRSGWSSCATG